VLPTQNLGAHSGSRISIPMIVSKTRWETAAEYLARPCTLTLSRARNMLS